MYDLILTSCGDPRDPNTWSGTPNNILRALERRGLRVHGVDWSLASRRIDRPGRNPFLRLAKRFRQVTHTGFQDLRTANPRGRAATYVAEQARLTGCTKILHTGTLDLPLPLPDPLQAHCLFCDTTWDLWARDATNMSQFDAAYVRAADELERAAYHQVEHIFPIGSYVTGSLVDHYGVEPTRITPVGTGLNTITPYNGEKDYANGHVLTVAKGRFEDKGGSLLLDAFRLARQTRPDLKLVIVGSQTNARFVLDPTNVTVTGFVPDDQLQRLFEEAALFAMPALNEPWGLVFLEALACKTPVLGLARNALPEMTRSGRYGFLVDEAAPEAVASALVGALGDPERLRRMGIEGQAHCLKTYSWDAVAERIATRILA